MNIRLPLAIFFIFHALSDLYRRPFPADRDPLEAVRWSCDPSALPVSQRGLGASLGRAVGHAIVKVEWRFAS